MSSKEKNKSVIENIFRAAEFSNRATGVIILQTTQIEGLINQIIATYFCKEKEKLEDCIAFIQETSFPHRLEYLKVIHKEVNTDFVSQLNFSKIGFGYIKHHGNPVMSLYDAVAELKTLRNHFAHSSVTPTNPGDELAVQLTTFKPRNKKQEKNEYPIKHVIEHFTEPELQSLVDDMASITKLLYDLFFKLSGNEYSIN